jgi:hypothetical protein
MPGEAVTIGRLATEVATTATGLAPARAVPLAAGEGLAAGLALIAAATVGGTAVGLAAATVGFGAALPFAFSAGAAAAREAGVGVDAGETACGGCDCTTGQQPTITTTPTTSIPMSTSVLFTSSWYYGQSPGYSHIAGARITMPYQRPHGCTLDWSSRPRALATELKDLNTSGRAASDLSTPRASSLRSGWQTGESPLSST